MADPLDHYRPKERVLARSVLDRLLDACPDVTQDSAISLAAQARELREAIRRDLEALLNTRRRPVSAPPELGELKDALVSFGVDSMVSANLATEEAKSALARAIERRITLFEKRLSDVRVTIPGKTAGERTLRMRIEAATRLHDGMPPISFETRLDPSSQRFLLEPRDG
ncbi:type VI secretion system baseplate subunit TssE [Chelativorans sp. AA-79]|uniref:type VI secretion system baseplate subunit TssE n=1 Tax=Chelativorans sp. AA-79 TaxID=3028735 RepID=UPI0023F7759F|nr:type VI secretion system baseplate subunit TssE [Chelativorans sp. AA-79]WEX08241.1 type VI secretion system baseplate subunit TssE [Chelativorans sp. AA-79]